jgi:hypothetical protein
MIININSGRGERRKIKNKKIDFLRDKDVYLVNDSRFLKKRKPKGAVL